MADYMGSMRSLIKGKLSKEDKKTMDERKAAEREEAKKRTSKLGAAGAAGASARAASKLNYLFRK